jgi:hypothetical protein
MNGVCLTLTKWLALIAGELRIPAPRPGNGGELASIFSSASDINAVHSVSISFEGVEMSWDA